MNTWRKVGCCLVAVAGLAFGAWADAVTFTFSDFAATVEVPETCVTMPMRLELSWGEGGHAVLADPVSYSGGSFAFYPEQLGIANGTEITAHLIAKYDLLDFIQSTQNKGLTTTGREQWLDTRTIITPTMSVEADYQLTERISQARVFSAGEKNKNCLIFAVYVNGGSQWASSSKVGNDGDWLASGVTADTSRHVHKLDNGTLSYYLDGVKRGSSHPVAAKPTNNSLYFFADHFNPVINGGNAKLYSGTITDGGVVVRRFLPAQVDGEVGLVDFVKDEFLPGDGKDYSNYPLAAGTVTNAAGTVMCAATATCAWTPVDPQEPGHAVVSFGLPEVGARHVSVPVKVYCAEGASVDFSLSFGQVGGAFETVAITNGVRNGDVFVATLIGLSPRQEYTIRPVIANVTVEAGDLVVNTLAYEEPPLGCPEITVEDDPNETESLTLTFAEPGLAVSLYCLTGVEDFGVDPSAWPAAVKVADIAADATSAYVLRPSGWGKTVGALRYYFSTTDDRSVAPKAMSRPSFYLALSAPSIVTIDSDVRWGDKAVLSGTFDGSADTLSVSYWKEGASVTQAVDGVLSGKTFSATIDPLEPSVVYGYRLLLAKGAATAQSTGTFTTPAAAGVTTSGTPSRANAQVSIAYSVTTQGAGDTFVWAEAKTDDGAYQAVSEPSVVAYGVTGIQSITVTSPYVDRTVDFRLAYSNACSRVENGSWLDTTDDVGVKVNDTTTYTFKPGGNGLYSAAENWTMNTTTGYGAPVSASATIVSPGGKTSDLKVDGAYAFSLWDWSGDEKTVVLSGVVANASLSGNIKGGLMRGQTFKFSDMTMTEVNGINIGGANDEKVWNDSYSNLLWIASGAVLGIPRGSGGIYLIGSRFSEVRVSDDGRLAVDYIACVCGSEGLMFRLQGASPRIETADRIGPHPNQAKDCAYHPTMDGDVVFRYEVTSAGYAQAPVAIAGTKEADRFGRLYEGSTGRYVIEVADDSPAFAERCRLRVPLLTCAAGIETNNVAFAPPGSRNKVEYYYQYGPEANLKEPQNQGDLPTGIWAKLTPPSGLAIMVR